MPCARKVQNRPQQPVTIFPNPQINPKIHQSCVNQPINKQTTQNKVLLVPRPAKITPHFMKPEGSLPCSQMLSTCPYPEPDSSSPHPTILIPSLRSTLILPSRLRLQVLPPTPPKPSTHFSFLQNTSHASFNSSPYIHHPNNNLASRNHEAPFLLPVPP